MAIQYYLQPNPITPDPDDHSARVISKGIRNLDDIVQQALKRGSALTEPDLLGAGKLLFDVIADNVAEGYTVHTPVANIRPGMKGVFDSARDTFDSSRHLLRPTLSEGSLLKEKMRTATPEKVVQQPPAPALTAFRDINSGNFNAVVTPGGMGEITGEELKFDAANPDEGIYFIASDGSEFKVEVLGQRTEGTLMFIIPAGLTAGEYTLEVRRAYTSDNTIRKGQLNDTLNRA